MSESIKLEDVSSMDMLRELARRGGHPGALAQAALLCARKSMDYNNTGDGSPVDIHSVDRTNYFPFGVVSYAQMLHTKAQRFNSLVLKQLAAPDAKATFEGLEDTAMDIINYAGFYISDPRTGDTK